MTRSRMFLLSGALLLGFFLVGSVLAVRLAVVTPSVRLTGGPLTLEVSVPGTAASTSVVSPGATRSLALGAADRLKVSGAWRVVLVPGPEGQAKVTVPDGSTQKLRIRNDGTTLTVDSNGSGRGNPVLEVSLPRLRNVEASGAAFLDLATLKADRFVLETSGASSVVGQGTVGSMEIHSSGAAQVDLGRVSANQVWVDSSGAANLVLRCDGTVDGQVSGAVNLLVKGNPSLRVNSSGAAHVTSGY